jgi:hypothetical protein
VDDFALLGARRGPQGRSNNSTFQRTRFFDYGQWANKYTISRRMNSLDHYSGIGAEEGLGAVE